MADDVQIPIGEREGERLEFKAASVLKSPAKIAREVVAMLNARGGVIWVGVGEADGKAAQIEAIPNADGAAQQLLNHLTDTIEPPPATEIEIQPVTAGALGDVLCIQVKQHASRAPFAQLKEAKWRYYAKRVGARIRTMTREEICADFGGGSRKADALDETIAAMRTWLQKEVQRTAPALHVVIRPAEKTAGDLTAARESVSALLRDARATGNRSRGWNFSSRYHEAKVARGKLEFGAYDAYTRTELRNDGQLAFYAPMSRLQRGKAETLYALALTEYPVSFFRLARRVYEQWFSLRPGSPLVAMMVLSGLKGWRLQPYSPASSFEPSDPRFESASIGEDEVLTDPMVVVWQDFLSNPDAVGIRGVRQFYEAFGFGPEFLPPEIDASRQMLVLAD